MIHKCDCGHPACHQYTLSNQGSVGFTKDEAVLMDNAHEMYEALLFYGLWGVLHPAHDDLVRDDGGDKARAIMAKIREQLR